MPFIVENLGVILLLTALGHSLFAVFVYRNASQRLQTGRLLYMTGRGGWTVLTLGTGVAGLLAYGWFHRR